MTTLKEVMTEQWNKPGVHHAGHLVAWEANALSHSIVGRAGTARNPQPDKETKKRRARLAMYNEKLRPIILAEATATPRNVEVAIVDGYGRPVKNGNKVQTEVKMLNDYRWPKADKAEPVAAIPRKRVPKAKLEQAAAIIAKVPPDELATFLAKFGLSLSLAASIASLDNAEMIARQFLRATL
jgi:hypothetical protein